MKSISFPAKKSPWREFTYDYALNIIQDFEIADYTIEFYEDTISTDFANSGCFFAFINGKKVLFDQSEYYDNGSWTCNKGQFSSPYLRYNYNIDAPIFKRMITKWGEYPENVFPLGPYCCSNPKLKALNTKSKYTPGNFKKLLHTNRVYGNAEYTRKVAFSKLNLPKIIEIDSTRTAVEEYYRRVLNSFGSLNITGASNYTQDSSNVEIMLLGGVIISNCFDILMPYNKSINGNEHYILINEDYSDINERIVWAFENQKEAYEIAKNGHNLIMETTSPIKRVKWIEEVIEEYYG